MNHLRSNLLSIALGLTLCFQAHVRAQSVVHEWTPDEIARWSGGNVRNARVAGGVLSLETQAGDAHWIGPVFDGFAAMPWQHAELTMKSEVAGRAELYWTGTTQSKHGGFSGEKRTSFEIVGDGEFRTYRIEPFWQAEKKIIRVRLDFPEATGGRYAIKSLRVVEDAPGKPVSLPAQHVTLGSGGAWHARVALRAEECAFVTLRMAVNAGDVGALSFASSTANGLKRITFPLRADGQMHTYNVEVGAESAWKGEIVGLRLEPASAKNARVRVESIGAGLDAQGSPDLEVTWLGLSDAWARSGKPVRLNATILNHGGETARAIKPQLALRGARLIKAEPAPETVEFGMPQRLAWTVQADEPGAAQATLALDGGTTTTATLLFREPVNLPKAAYVPEPKPAKTDYLVGAYLFPGWSTSSAWARLKPYPERQPLLGWYREELPEVADWQIKWAVEHGINFFLYDWYWDRGNRHHEHGLHSALFNARYQDLIKFCLLYANHNAPGSHSAEDFEAMTRFWIDNYFKRPNYLRIDGKPVIVMFAPMNPARDLGGNDKVKACFEKMRAMCREAGVGGIYFVACMPPDTKRLPALKEMGYDAVSAYNWPGVNMTDAEKTAKRAPFATCAEGHEKAWDEIAAANVLKLIPPVCGGWDARPWHGESTLVRTGRTPELFKKHLEATKRFLDTQEQAPKLKMLLVEAWNEWGEGSYIEPHREFGFGYLEAIRQVFAPGSPKPAEFVPSDIGLGPYDVAESPEVTAWDFAKATTALDWTGNVANLRSESGALRFTTRGHDPILTSPTLRAHAARFPVITFRLKASRDTESQLFWTRHGAGTSEAASVRFPIKGDGEFHDVKVRAADNPLWRGFLTGLRFDPGNQEGIEIAVESIRLAEQ